ncbi:MAG: hypothetical protein HRT88_03400 [Lentisphaeraceae bacterium]|nr:hypothetical protein [Lentisphaeraceae bacterium]
MLKDVFCSVIGEQKSIWALGDYEECEKEAERKYRQYEFEENIRSAFRQWAADEEREEE